MSIVVAGAINTDLVATMRRAPEGGETITGTGFAIHGGGKGGNQAVAVARSGSTVRLLGAVGDDAFGQARLADLLSAGVDTSLVQVNPEQASGVALIFVEEGGENRIAYVPGATSTVQPQAVDSVFDTGPVKYVLATNELDQGVLRALFGSTAESGAQVVFNPTPDPERARDVLEHVSILVLNRGEAAAILGRSEGASAIDTCSALLESTQVPTVIVTSGADGVYVGDRSGILHVPAPVVEVVDTTGAGDTFCGWLVGELGGGLPIALAIESAVAASALSVTRSGAQSSIPTRDEVDAFRTSLA